MQAAGLDKPLKLQVPKVVTARIESAVEFELGKTIIIRGLAAEPVKGKSRQLLVMVTARRGNRPEGINQATEVADPSADLKVNPSEYKKLPRLAPGPYSREHRYAMVYDVADLITSNLDSIIQGEFEARDDDSTTKRKLDILLQVIRKRVAPKSWQAANGVSRIQPYPTNLSLAGLVVSQTEEIHAEVVKFLQDLRSRLGLLTADRPLPPRKRSKQVYLQVYNVADLVIPIPQSIRDPKAVSAAVFADIDRLIELITSTVAPESWDSLGGPGEIEPFATNLSLVASQSSEIHEEIAELLEQLRRLRDVQVTLQARFIRAPRGFWERSGLDFDFKSADAVENSLGGDCALLSGSQANLLLHEAHVALYAGVLASPSVTVFNGQHASISLSRVGRDLTLRFQAACSADRVAVHLRLAFDADLSKALVHNIPVGGALAVRVPQAEANRVENERADDRPLLLLITPGIIVRQEEANTES